MGYFVPTDSLIQIDISLCFDGDSLALEHVLHEVSYSISTESSPVQRLSQMATEGPRHAEVTPFDHGALIQIPAWFFMVVAILVTFLKLAVRFKATRNPGLDDAVCFFAMVNKPGANLYCLVDHLLMKSNGQLLGVGQTITISLAVNNGLGKSTSIRDVSLTSNVQKVSQHHPHLQEHLANSNARAVRIYTPRTYYSYLRSPWPR